MSTRQYIGARYVPKFFNGEGGSTEWISGVAYEPLTIVTHLGNSYTSKKPVPVGVDILNTEYWASTGLWNSQVEQYREEVEAYAETVDTLAERVNEIDDMFYSLDYLKSKKYILIGDSYAEFTHSWLNKLKEKLELVEGTNVFSSAIGGTGFVNGNPTWVQTIGSITAPEDIDYILVVGGYNDRGGANIPTAINTFVTTAKTRFPNAKVLVGMCAWNAHDYDDYIVGVYKNYKEGCKSAGAIYMDNIEYTLHNYDYVNTDGFHPVDAGSISIYNFLLEYLQKGYANVYMSGTGTVENETGITGNITYSYSLCNEQTRININLLSFSCSKTFAFNNTAFLLGAIKCPIIGRQVGAIVPCYLKDSGNNFYSADVSAYLNGRGFYISTIQTNDARNNFRDSITLTEFGGIGRVNISVDSMTQI